MIKPKIHAEDLTIFLVSGLILFSYGLYALFPFDKNHKTARIFCLYTIQGFSFCRVSYCIQYESLNFMEMLAVRAFRPSLL